MIDIESKIAGLKSTWVHRIIYNSNPVIVRLYKTHLKQFGEKLFFECNMQTKDVDKLNISSTFLKDVLYSWTKASYTEPTCIGKEIIWNNSNITDQNKKTFFYHKWYDRSIKFIDHIYDYKIQSFYNFQNSKNCIRSVNMIT